MMLFLIFLILSQENEILLKKKERIFYPLRTEMKRIPQIKERGFIITSFYFEPDDTAYVTDTIPTFYRITSYDWNILDTVYWFFYYPDNDTLTGEPTGEYVKCAEAKWVHTHEDSINLLSYWVYEVTDIWGHWEYGIEIIPVPSPEYLNDIDCGWGVRFAEEIYSSGACHLLETSFFPSKWYVELWRGPAGGSRYFIKKDSFEVKDTFTYLKIISPSSGDTVIGKTPLEVGLEENHWAICSLIVSSEPMGEQREIWVKTFKVDRWKYPYSTRILFNFGFNEGQWFKVKGKIIDYSGNIKTDSISVVVGRPILAIELSSEEVKPYYENFIPENESKTQVIVHVFTPFGRPVEGYPVKVFARGVTKSGGHDHDGMDTLQYPRPVGIFTITEGFTDESGKFITTYRASEFGGIEKIFACGNVILPKDTVHKELTVRVPGLFLFPEGPYWLKVGGTCNHHGPPKPWDPIPTQCQEPDHNHYIAPLTYMGRK